MAPSVQCKITSSDLNRVIELELELAKCKHCNQIYKTSQRQTKTSIVCIEVVAAVVEVVGRQYTVINFFSALCNALNTISTVGTVCQQK